MTNGYPVTYLEFFSKEKVEGESLAERLANTALAPEEALRYAIDLGAALNRAHVRGMVHGRLSPQAIVLNDSGAHILEPQELDDESVAPYRAPELIRGAEPDTTSDIFAFGAVLYEMVSRRRAFTGEGTELDEVILRNPAPALLAKSPIHAAMEGVIAGCLEKDPALRRQRVQNAVIELKLAASTLLHPIDRRNPAGISEKSPGTAPPRAIPRYRLAVPSERSQLLGEFGAMWRRSGGMRRLILGGGIVLLLLVVLAVGAMAYFHSKPTPVYQFPVTPPEHAAYRMPAISPDGRYLAVSAQGTDGKLMLWLHPLDSDPKHWTAVPKTEGAVSAFWSPDSQYVAFFANHLLQKVKVPGGSPETICPAEVIAGGGSWSKDGLILFAPGQTGGLFTVRADGGKPQPATTLNTMRYERGQLWPQFLPDGKHFIFFVLTDMDETTGVYAGSLGSANYKLLFSSHTNAVYSSIAGKDSTSQGYLLFIQEGALIGQPFRASKMENNGTPIRLAEGIGAVRSQSLSPISVSDNAILVYQSIGKPTHQMVWMDRNGKTVSPPSDPGEWGPPKISPDGSRAVLGKLGSNDMADLWLLQPNGNATQFTDTPYQEGSPAWSPDGSRIAFSANPGGADASYDIFVKPVNGGKTETLFKSPQWKYPTDWTRDGKYVLFGSLSEGTRSDVWAFSTSDHHAAPIIDTIYNEGYGELSPDGKWLAFQSDQSGRNEVYVQAFEGLTGGTKRSWKISASGGGLPRWRGDGSELFYITKSGLIMSATIHTSGNDFGFDAPRTLFQTRPLPDTWNLYDVSRDGQLFILNVPLEWSGPSPITVVTNWTEKLND
jgi:eukaryotic-like serine/threonine-protein kinase